MLRWSSLLALPLLLTACTRAEKLDLLRLKAPAGFHLAPFGQTPHPRMMAFSPGGVLVVTDSTEGKVVAFPDPKHTGRAERAVVVAEELNEPHGIAFHNGKLYIAETNQVQRFDWDEAKLAASHGQVLAKLPTSGGGHSTRTLLFHHGKMYVSAGSSCNVCQEEDPRRAAVMQFNDDGSGMKIFASGLRNAVGLAIHPGTDTIWATVNGRDRLGDDIPPDVINDLGSGGGFFGWPYCYGNRIPDPTQTKVGDDRCSKMVSPKVEIQAHSAPLGLAFYDGQMFPAAYHGDIFVALHGSWNRSVPTGYKVIRVRLDDKGQPKGAEDFLTGWIAPGEKRKGVWMGRPAEVAVGPDGALYVSDDDAGQIYRVTWSK